jgi:hypothetical protein
MSSAPENKRTMIAELLCVMQRLNLTLVLHEELGVTDDTGEASFLAFCIRQQFTLRTVVVQISTELDRFYRTSSQ